MGHSRRPVWLRFPGLGLHPGRTWWRSIVPVQARAHDIVTATGKCFRSVTNWIHLGNISVRTCRLPSCGRKVTERNVYPTVQRRPRPLSLPRGLAGAGSHSLTSMSCSFTDVNVIFEASSGRQSSGPRARSRPPGAQLTAERPGPDGRPARGGPPGARSRAQTGRAGGSSGLVSQGGRSGVAERPG